MTIQIPFTEQVTNKSELNISNQQMKYNIIVTHSQALLTTSQNVIFGTGRDNCSAFCNNDNKTSISHMKQDLSKIKATEGSPICDKNTCLQINKNIYMCCKHLSNKYTTYC